MSDLKATYTQLRDGSWGIKVQGRVVSGDSVIVTKKDGTTKTEVITRLLWQGNDSKTGQTISLCAIRPMSQGYHGSSETKVCWECGRRFTYSQCKQSDGDWSDSYCGC